MKKEHKIIHLPTDDAIGSALYKGDKLYEWGENLKEKGIPQHLYILSDEEIKEGDWVASKGGIRYVTSLNKCGEKFTDDGKISKQEASPMCYLDNYKKIIATTDKSLKIECQGCRFNKNSGDVVYTCICKTLPQIPQSLIKAYAEKQMDSVMLEYNEKTLMKPADVYVEKAYWLKLKDNQVVWSRVEKSSLEQAVDMLSEKEKMYSEEEFIEQLLWDVREFHINTPTNDIHPGGYTLEYAKEKLKNWIKENLK